MSETEEERASRARNLAYTQGRRDADVDAHLRSHEKRLNAINGSIEKHARNAEALRVSIEEVKDVMRESVDEVKAMVSEIASSQLTQRALEAQRVQAVAAANEKQISSKQFWLGVVTICVMFSLGIATLIVKAHGG